MDLILGWSFDFRIHNYLARINLCQYIVSFEMTQYIDTNKKRFKWWGDYRLL